MRFKAISFLTAVIMTAAVFTGCGSGDSSSQSVPDASSEAQTEQAEASSAGEMRDLTANEYAKEMGIGINLGNTFEAYWEDKGNATTGAQTIGENTPLNYETCWGAVETTKECIDGMAAAGFSTVRVPVYWGNMSGDLKRLFDRLVGVMMGESSMASLKVSFSYCSRKLTTFPPT